MLYFDTHAQIQIEINSHLCFTHTCACRSCSLSASSLPVLWLAMSSSSGSGSGCTTVSLSALGSTSEPAALGQDDSFFWSRHLSRTGHTQTDTHIVRLSQTKPSTPIVSTQHEQSMLIYCSNFHACENRSTCVNLCVWPHSFTRGTPGDVKTDEFTCLCKLIYNSII